MTTRAPRPGDFGVTKVPGQAGWWIGLGERLMDGHNKFDHAFLVIDDAQLIEAQPGGAAISPLSEWSHASFSAMDLTDEQRAAICAAGKSMRGVPYGWLDYASLILAHFRIRAGFVKRRVNDGSHMICSQLVDAAYFKAGVHLFDDGRLPGDVTPGDLGTLLSR
jgi:uncharacterized protein YycO